MTAEISCASLLGSGCSGDCTWLRKIANGIPGCALEFALMLPSLSVHLRDACDKTETKDKPAHLISRDVHRVYKMSSHVITVAPARMPAH